MKNFFRQTIFTLGFINAMVKDLPRRLRFHYYLWRYGKGNIPDDKVKNIMGETTPEMARTMETCSEVADLSVIINRQLQDLQLGLDIIHTMRGNLIEQDRLKIFNGLTSIENRAERRRVIVAQLKADGDLTEAMVNFNRQAIDDFLEAKPTQSSDQKEDS